MFRGDGTYAFSGTGPQHLLAILGVLWLMVVGFATPWRARLPRSHAPLPWTPGPATARRLTFAGAVLQAVLTAGVLGALMTRGGSRWLRDLAPAAQPYGPCAVMALLLLAARLPGSALRVAGVRRMSANHRSLRSLVRTNVLLLVLLLAVTTLLLGSEIADLRTLGTERWLRRERGPLISVAIVLALRAFFQGRNSSPAPAEVVEQLRALAQPLGLDKVTVVVSDRGGADTGAAVTGWLNPEISRSRCGPPASTPRTCAGCSPTSWRTSSTTTSSCGSSAACSAWP